MKKSTITALAAVTNAVAAGAVLLTLRKITDAVTGLTVDDDAEGDVDEDENDGADADQTSVRLPLNVLSWVYDQRSGVTLNATTGRFTVNPESPYGSLTIVDIPAYAMQRAQVAYDEAARAQEAQEARFGQGLPVDDRVSDSPIPAELQAIVSQFQAMGLPMFANFSDAYDALRAEDDGTDGGNEDGGGDDGDVAGDGGSETATPDETVTDDTRTAE